MWTWEYLKELLNKPLVTLAGGPITAFGLFTGVVIFFGTYVLARLSSRGIVRLLQRQHVAEGARAAIAKIARYIIVFIGLLMALTSLGIRLDALFAASTVLLVGIGFGLQNIAQNFVSGLILLIEQPVAEGDFVRVGNAYGSVVDVGLRATRVVTRDEVTIIVPNSELVTAQVINHSVPTPNLRISVNVGVAYETDTAKVKDVLLAVARADDGLLRTPEPEVRLEDFGPSSLDFQLLVWIANPREDLRAKSRLRFAIDAAFRDAGIVIPLPQRHVHIKSQAST